VTDTVTDVERCNSLELSAIGVAWGYDAPRQLTAAGASEVAEHAGDLHRILSQRGLI
jgi:phosphoglycolate phosphatase-like HAD superfamily hydrolase